MVAAIVMTGARAMMTGEKERERVEVEGVGGCRTRRRRWRAGEREEGA